MAKHFVYDPVLFDQITERKVPLAAGTVVRKVQPHGCPKNGTMGQCYVEGVVDGTFYGLVMVNSLTPLKQPPHHPGWQFTGETHFEDDKLYGQYVEQGTADYHEKWHLIQDLG